MIDCQELSFNPLLSCRRWEKASKIFGSTVIRRIVCWALYLLGAKRKDIAEMLEQPENSVKSFLRSLDLYGLPALEDRRRGHSSFLPQTQPRVSRCQLSVSEDGFLIDIGVPEHRIIIPRQNTVQCRTVLLSLLNSGCVRSEDVAGALSLTTTHIANLAKQLASEDVTGIIDKRHGPKSEHLITPEIKGEIIQQFVVNCLIGGRISGKGLADNLQERDLNISDRTIRFHLGKLGLRSIKTSLPELYDAVKKTSETS